MMFWSVTILEYSNTEIFIEPEQIFGFMNKWGMFGLLTLLLSVCAFGSGTQHVQLGSSPVQKDLTTGIPIEFSVGVLRLPIAIVLSRVDIDSGTTDWLVNGKPVKVNNGTHAQFDLSRDKVSDIDIKLIDVRRNGALVEFSLLGATSNSSVNMSTNVSNNATFPVASTVKVVITNSTNKSSTNTSNVSNSSITIQKKQQMEVSVPLTAVVPEPKELLVAKLSNLFKKMNVDLSPNSWLVKVGIVLVIVVLGLIGFALSRSYYE